MKVYYSENNEIETLKTKIQNKYGTDKEFEEMIEYLSGEDEYTKFMNDKTVFSDKIKNKIKRIGGGIYTYDDSINTLELPEGITSIGSYAFSNCTNLALTSLPEGITSISDWAFSYCTNLALTSLPEGITSIGSYAFYICTNLRTMTIGSIGHPVTSIASNSFEYCTNLTSMTIYTTNAQPLSDAPFGAYYATITYLNA